MIGKLPKPNYDGLRKCKLEQYYYRMKGRLRVRYLSKGRYDVLALVKVPEAVSLSLLRTR